MSYTYADVARAARDLSVWFDQSRIPSGSASRLFAAVERDLVVKTTRRDPERLSTTQTLTGSAVVASLGTPPLGIALLPAHVYIRAQVVLAGSLMQPDTLTLITADRLGDWTYGAAWYVSGSTAYFTGQASDWSNISSVIITYIPFVSDIVTETDAVVMPDEAKDVLVARLALAMALRVNGMPVSTEQPSMDQTIQIDVSAFKAMADDAETQWLSQVSDQRRKSRLSIRNGADLS